jgi:hypothetical protein
MVENPSLSLFCGTAAVPTMNNERSTICRHGTGARKCALSLFLLCRDSISPSSTKKLGEKIMAFHLIWWSWDSIFVTKEVVTPPVPAPPNYAKRHYFTSFHLLTVMHGSAVLISSAPTGGNYSPTGDRDNSHTCQPQHAINQAPDSYDTIR